MDRYGATNMMQSPNLRKAFQEANENHTVLLGSTLGIGSVANAKIMAATSSDFVWVDAEHTPYSPTLLAEVVQTLKMYSHGKVIPVVRVPNHSHEWIAYALDAGAGGVVIPHTETVEQVKASIAAARFPPHGHRSFPPFSLIIGMQDTAPEGKTWMDVASEHCAVIPQIESRKGVENLEDIMQIPGVDAIMIGHGDLQLDVGADMDLMLTRIYSLAKKYKMPLVGAVFKEEELAGRYAQGYRMLTSAFDVLTLAYGIEKQLKEGREVLEKARNDLLINSQETNGQGAEKTAENGNGKLDT